jgi:hypothetical protein
MWLCQGLAVQMTSEVVVSAGVRLSTDVAASDIARQDPYTDWTTVVAGFARQAVEVGELDQRWDPDLVGRVVVRAYTGVQTVSDVMTRRADLFAGLRELWTVLLDAFVTERLRPEIPRLVALIAPE